MTTNCFFFGRPSDTYPFGPSVGDSELRGDDVTARRIFVRTDFPAFSRNFRYIYIGTNGIISLDQRFNPYTPRNFSLVTDKNFIAPYWTDIDVRTSNSRVYYQVYDINDINHTWRLRSTCVLLRASNEVNRFYNINFRAEFVVVITWYRVVPYGPRTSDEEITFQVLMISDGRDSFVIYNYLSMNWRLGRGRYLPTIGYHITYGNKQIVHSQRPSSYVIDRYPGITDIRGYYMFRLSEPHTGGPNYKRQCYQWYRENIRYQWSYNRISQNQFLCPCRFRDMNFDRRWLPSLDRRKPRCWYLMPQRRFTRTLSKECCYDRRGNLARFGSNLIRSSPDAGGIVQCNPWVNRTGYAVKDSDPKDICCHRSNLCHLYYLVRPIGACYTRLWFRFGWLFGDPHIDTLDGGNYTFNGYGEYIMLKIDTQNETFELQARTTPYTNENGTASNATVFSAFAGKDDGGSTFQVELTESKNKMVVYGNGQDFSRRFNDDQTFRHLLGDMTLSRDNNSLVVALSSGISLTFGIGVRTLTVSTGIPEEDFKNQTTGLLGNFDGNRNNDFILPDGTVLHENDTNTERKIFFNYGQKWMVNSSNSIFKYPDGKSWKDYSHPEFIPIFVDEYPKEERDKAKAECGGERATQTCIFDYLATGSREVARDSGSVDETAVAIAKETNNEAPQISADTSIQAEVGKSVTIRINGSDDGNFTFYIVDRPSNGLTFNKDDGVIYWIPENTNPVNISIAAVDDGDKSSPVLDLDITICSGCNNNGTCNLNETRDSNHTNFRLNTCNCNPGWTGDDCEIDADGCSEFPCSIGRNCSDVTPEQEIATGFGFVCSPCPDGFFDDGEKCEDINECNGTNTCDQICVNTEGSYICVCENGYRRHNSVCRDNDECTEGTAECEQICINEVGDYKCSCVYGFELTKNDNKTCTQVLDVCAINNLNCSYACDNNTADGSYKCICPNGYKLVDDNCKDINECKSNICTQTCTNTNGSYVCSCFDGYTLDKDKISCTACELPYWGKNCEQICECGIGSSTCDPSRGCICDSGWQGSNCSIDIDECTVNPGICQSDQLCENLDGSYQCNCQTGFEKSGSNCQNINECNFDSLNNCSLTESTCEDNEGSFTCRCNLGYQQNGPFDCIDINECTINAHDCEHMCTNVNGSYNCECRFGFEINDDRVSCRKVSDPCATFANLTCSYGCILEGEKASCFCSHGYKLGPDQQTCIDVNECMSSTTNQCSQQDTCENYDGGYHCNCSKGFYLENDNRTCTECDQYHWGQNCMNKCNCGRGSERCDKIKGCQCLTGWIGSYCSADVDECMQDPCASSNENCLNTPGSYICQCKPGYRRDSNQNCTNINECIENTGLCEQLCEDTEGSYKCSCRPGFQLNENKQCKDIDECSLGQHNCDQECINTVGKYMCSCFDGYLLNTTNRQTCYAKTICLTKACNQSCAVKSGGQEYCSCSRGYELQPDEISCQNIDECLSSPCTHTCTDTTPGYSCSCNPGYVIDRDGVTCIECTTGYYGHKCENQCACAASNTYICNHVNGSCVCKNGWTGNNCQTDINECDIGSYDCVPNSECKNKAGSYNCECYAGYMMSSNGQCAECDSQKYGKNCGGTCQCIFDNTNSCDNVNGTCYCKQGWKGLTCNENINECRQFPDICGNNSICLDTDGSFKCSCKSGYNKDSEGTCLDINECATKQHNCNIAAECINTEGSFDCKCLNGYTGSGFSCADVNECTSGNNNCSIYANCENKMGSYICVCKQEYSGDGYICEATEENSERYNFIFTFGITVQSNLASNNTAYTIVSREIIHMLTVFYRGQFDSSFLGLKINSIRQGSIIVDHELILVKESATQAQVSKVMVDILSDKTVMNYKGNNVTANKLVYLKNGKQHTLDATSINNDVCTIFVSLSPCEDKHTCTVESDGKPKCVPEEQSDNFSMIIGIAIGLPVGIIVILAMTVMICLIRQQKKGNREEILETSSNESSIFAGRIPTKISTQGFKQDMFTPPSDYPADSLRSNESVQRRGLMSYIPRGVGGWMSNFRWGNFYNQIGEKEFKIKRPKASATPNMAYVESEG